MKDLYSVLTESADGDLARKLLKMATKIKTKSDYTIFVICAADGGRGKKALFVAKTDADYKLDRLLPEVKGLTYEIDGQECPVVAHGVFITEIPSAEDMPNAETMKEYSQEPICTQKEWRKFISDFHLKGVAKEGMGDYMEVVNFGRQKLKR